MNLFLRTDALATRGNACVQVCCGEIWRRAGRDTVAELAAGCTCSTRVRDLTCLDKRALAGGGQR